MAGHLTRSHAELSPETEPIGNWRRELRLVFMEGGPTSVVCLEQCTILRLCTSFFPTIRRSKHNLSRSRLSDRTDDEQPLRQGEGCRPCTNDYDQITVRSMLAIVVRPVSVIKRGIALPETNTPRRVIAIASSHDCASKARLWWQFLL